MITSFDEFKYFKGASIPGNAFRNCVNLLILNTVHYNKGQLSGGTFTGSGMYYMRFKKVSIQNSGGAVDGAFALMPNLLGIWFEELTNAGIGGMHNAHSHYNIITNNYVATAGQMARWHGETYVPDELVPTYKSTSGWSNKTIMALSTLPTYHPTCPWLDELRELGYID